MHLVIPILALLAFRYNTKRVFLLAPFAWLPDITWISGFHRIYTTNIFFLSSVIFLVYLVSKKFFRENYREITIIVAFMIFSHLILDFEAFIALFYPVYPKYFYSTAQITVTRPEFNITPSFGIFTADLDAIPKYYTSYFLATPTSLVVLFLLIVLTYHLIFDRDKIKKLIK